MSNVNIPLLRKAVEWAEVEAALPQCHWVQAMWEIPPDKEDKYEQDLRREAGLTSQCGSSFCIAGYVLHLNDKSAAEMIAENRRHGRPHSESVQAEAARLLGISSGKAETLFSANNKIEDVRRIAEAIAGEPL